MQMNMIDLNVIEVINKYDQCFLLSPQSFYLFIMQNTEYLL